MVRRLAVLLLVTCCSQVAKTPQAPRIEPCWFDRAASSRFAMRGDGELVVLRELGTTRTLSRVRRDGTVVWDAIIEAPGGRVEAIALDDRGDVVLVGEAERPERATPDVRLPGCFLSKHSGVDGRARWSTVLAGTGNQFCRDVAVDTSGDVVVAGYFERTLEASTGTLTSAGSYDVVVLRVAGDTGNVIWARQLGGRNNDMARAVAVDRFGDVIVGGNFSGEGVPADGAVDFGAGALRSAGDFDAFVVKLSADGKTRWARTFGDVGFDLVKSIASDRDGNLYVAGAWMRPQDFGGKNAFHAGVMDGFVARHTRDGTLVWRQIFLGGAGSQAHDIAVDGQQRPWIVGHIKGAVTIAGRALGSPDRAASAPYVAGLDASGRVRWAELLGGPAAGYGYRVAIAPDESIVVGGRSEGNGTFCGALANGPPDGDEYIEWFKRGYL